MKNKLRYKNMKRIELENSVLDALDMNSRLNEIQCYHAYFTLESGREHYRLLRYLSSKVNSHVIEIGTHCGSSAFAMSMDTNHDIITYDITDIKNGNLPSPKNVIYKISEFMDDDKNKELILSARMIFIDAPHNGDYETACYEWFKENKYSGIVVWDDIHLNENMEIFWENVTHKKIDVTKYGHVTGTGIVNFSNDMEIILK